jgi:vacuolar-type H+-ATPase subunit E/Vma4
LNKEITGNRDFLDEILISAREEAKKILTQAEEKARLRREMALKQEEALIKEGEKQLEEIRIDLEKRANRKIASEKRRRELQLRDRFMNQAMEKARETLVKQTEDESYSKILADWVIEAALGLGVDKIELNGRMVERKIMTPSWLKQCEKTLEETYGHKVTLTVSKESALISAGVVAKEKDGRLVYNNQIDTRLLRKQSDLRKVIYSSLFEDKFDD